MRTVEHANNNGRVSENQNVERIGTETKHCDRARWRVPGPDGQPVCCRGNGTRQRFAKIVGTAESSAQFIPEDIDVSTRRCRRVK